MRGCYDHRSIPLSPGKVLLVRYPQWYTIVVEPSRQTNAFLGVEERGGVWLAAGAGCNDMLHFKSVNNGISSQAMMAFRTVGARDGPLPLAQRLAVVTAAASEGAVLSSQAVYQQQTSWEGAPEIKLCDEFCISNDEVLLLRWEFCLCGALTSVC